MLIGWIGSINTFGEMQHLYIFFSGSYSTSAA